MRSHVLRPLWVAIAAIALSQAVRFVMVPPDFGVHGQSFTYGYYRLSNIDEWKNFRVKYKGKESCAGDKCHDKNVKENLSSNHKVIECENCHDPNPEHLNDPKKFEYKIDRSRRLCVRCHAYLPYPGNFRSKMKVINPQKHFHAYLPDPGNFRSKTRAIDPQKHYLDRECAVCHNPHKSNVFSERLSIPHRPKFKEIK